MIHAVICFTSQMSLCGLILIQLFIVEKSTLVSPTFNALIDYCRFICAGICHFAMISEATCSLQAMKYCLNHPYKFKDYKIAFSFMLMQFVSCMTVEFCNLMVIMFSLAPVAMAENFIALAIIADFDNFTYESIFNEPLKKLLYEEVKDDLNVIAHTTSKKCKPDELSTVKDETGQLRKLRVNFNERLCCNKALFVLYKMLRVWFVSIYFYFMPTIVIVFTIIGPLT